jgi:hypothetical protein
MIWLSPVIRQVHCAAALRDGLFAHLAGYSGTETVHELIVA